MGYVRQVLVEAVYPQPLHSDASMRTILVADERYITHALLCLTHPLHLA